MYCVLHICLFAHFVAAVNRILRVCKSLKRHTERMGALCFSLTLLLLLSSPVRAQWWSLIWANPKSSSGSSPSSVPSSITSPSITSPGLSYIPGTTVWVGKEDRMTEKASEGSTQTGTPTPSPAVSISGHSTAKPGTPPPDESSNGRSQYKPLKHWKSGECYRGGGGGEKRGGTKDI